MTYMKRLPVATLIAILAITLTPPRDIRGQ